jgi:hypothetical protein
MSLPKIFGIAAVVFGTVYGLAGVPNNNRVKSGDYDADAARVLGVRYLVEQTSELDYRIRIGQPEAYLALRILITSTVDTVTIKKIVLNRGNCDGFLKADGKDYEIKGKEDIQGWKRPEMHYEATTVELKFGEQIKIGPRCDKILEVSVTTSDDQVRVYTF